MVSNLCAKDFGVGTNLDQQYARCEALKLDCATDMRLSGVDFLGGYLLRLSFPDGLSAELNLEPALEPDDILRQPELFRQGKLNGLTLEWPGGIDFCPDVLHLWCEAGRVLSEAETKKLLEPDCCLEQVNK
jgi:hypothetical protein